MPKPVNRIIRWGLPIVGVATAVAVGSILWRADEPPRIWRSIDATGSPQVAARLSRNAEGGRLLFERFCVFCHGRSADGFGINAPNLPVPVPPLVDATARSDAELVAIITGGGRSVGRSNSMPAWGARLAARDVEALVAYIRALPIAARLHRTLSPRRPSPVRDRHSATQTTDSRELPAMPQTRAALHERQRPRTDPARVS